MATESNRPEARATRSTEDDMRVQLTPNQIVAYNLAQARAVAGLDAGGGGRATSSRTSVRDGRRRASPQPSARSTASGFASSPPTRSWRSRAASALPVGFFFLPPRRAPSDARSGSPHRRIRRGASARSELIDVVFGAPGEIGVHGDAARGVLPPGDRIELLTEAQDALTWHAEACVEAVVMTRPGPLRRVAGRR